MSITKFDDNLFLNKQIEKNVENKNYQSVSEKKILQIKGIKS